MNNVQITNSFVQDQKFQSKSDRFKVVTPSDIGQVLTDFNFEIVHLKTAKSKLVERRDFQTTIARYRSKDGFEIDGLSMDLIFKVPHLYGKIEGILGLFRGICSNQINVGQRFETIKLAHTGNPMETIKDLIPTLVAQRSQLIDTVKEMKSKQIDARVSLDLAKQIADFRLKDTENIQTININSLLQTHRDGDIGQDLFTVMNIIQENIVRYPMSYSVKQVNQLTGDETTRQLRTRPVKDNTARSIELNKFIWDASTQLLTA